MPPKQTIKRKTLPQANDLLKRLGIPNGSTWANFVDRVKAYGPSKGITIEDGLDKYQIIDLIEAHLQRQQPVTPTAAPNITDSIADNITDNIADNITDNIADNIIADVSTDIAPAVSVGVTAAIDPDTIPAFSSEQIELLIWLQEEGVTSVAELKQTYRRNVPRFEDMTPEEQAAFLAMTAEEMAIYCRVNRIGQSAAGINVEGALIRELGAAKIDSRVSRGDFVLNGEFYELKSSMGDGDGVGKNYSFKSIHPSYDLDYYMLMLFSPDNKLEQYRLTKKQMIEHLTTALTGANYMETQYNPTTHPITKENLVTGQHTYQISVSRYGNTISAYKLLQKYRWIPAHSDDPDNDAMIAYDVEYDYFAPKMIAKNEKQFERIFATDWAGVTPGFDKIRGKWKFGLPMPLPSISTEDMFDRNPNGRGRRKPKPKGSVLGKDFWATRAEAPAKQPRAKRSYTRRPK